MMNPALVLPDLINSFGLLVDIVGAGFLAYALPEKADVLGTLYTSPWELSEEDQKQWRRHRRRWQLGVSLLVVGFSIQIVSNHMG